MSANLYYAAINGLRCSLSPTSPVFDGTGNKIYHTQNDHALIGLPIGPSVYSLFNIPASSGFTTTGLASGVYDLGLSASPAGVLIYTASAWVNNTTPPVARSVNAEGLDTIGTNTVLLCSFFVNASGNVIDTTSSRWLSNVYNTYPRLLSANDSTSSWTCSSTSWQPMNGNTTDGVERVSFVNWTNLPVEVRATQAMSPSTGVIYMGTGLVFDSTTSADVFVVHIGAVSYSPNLTFSLEDSSMSKIGYHYCQKVQSVASASTQTYYGTSPFFTGKIATMTGEIIG